MSGHYSLKNFLRKAQNKDLESYFKACGIEIGVDWKKLKETKIDPVADAIDKLNDEIRQKVESDFLAIHSQILLRIIDANLIAPYPADITMTCPGCEESCLMPVQAGNGIRQPFIVCEYRDDIGRVPVNLESLKRWVFSYEALSLRLSNLMDSPLPSRMLISDRLFYCGQIETASGQSDIFLASDLSSADHEEIKQSIRCVFLILDENIETGQPAIDLRKVLSFKNGVLTLDTEVINKALAVLKPASHENIFRRDGATWAVQFQGQSRSVKHTGGMIYLAHLLANPGQPYHVSELNQLLGNASVLESSLSGSAADTAAIRKKLLALKEKINDAEERGDAEKVEILRDEQDTILKNMQSQTGIDGKPKTGSDAGDKARQRIQKSIKTAMDNIQSAGLSTLHDHLKASVETGFSCTYRPAVSIGWKIFSDVKP